MLAWLDNTTSFTEQTACPVTRFGARCQPTTWSIGTGHSAILISTILATTLIAAAMALRRRDIT